MIHLVLGGARSGKSQFAENLASSLSNKQSENHLSVCYIATATAGDIEMERRIAHHKKTRPSNWDLVEEPLHLSSVIADREQKHEVVLIDCLTLWLSNWLCSNKQSEWLEEKERFVSQLQKSEKQIILVSNEVGSGIVPMGELSRDFVDHAGWLNQVIAKIADKASLIVAGCEVPLKTGRSEV